MSAVRKREAHLVTGLLLLVSFGVAMADDVLKLRRIVPAQRNHKSQVLPHRFLHDNDFTALAA